MAVSQGWLAGSLFAVIPQKWVNNQMEVNEMPKQSGGDDENMTKASKADGNTFIMVIYRKMVHFLMSLNYGGTFSQCLCLFFNELEFHVKTARSNRIIRMSNTKQHFFKALPHILSLCKLGNDQSYSLKG